MDGTLLSAIAASGAMIAAQAGTPPEKPPEDYVVTSIWSKSDLCNRSIATSVELKDLVAKPSIWEGKCVAIDGYWAHRTLFATRRDADKDPARSGGARRQRRVGIYAADTVLTAAPKRPQAFTIVGIAGRCETLGDGAIMVMGYCHYSGGPYIAVAETHRR